MAALKSDVKAFIVQALACFDTPSQVSQAVKQEFDIDVTRQQVEQHDPTKRAGSHLALKWQTLFHDTRKRFREETADIPIANRAFRLRGLARMAEKAENMRNLALTAQLYEQAAKECGDMYVNRARKEEPDDEPLTPTRIQVDVVDARKPDAQP
ncbi:DUF2280 domain-containing protein [Pseudomonas protegens]|uniref:DUF2280 domain-containing protein n=1 Tax=Pseudomonas protegens (strain DSM 19095 / LMG 27888 / CFBP 6595 / CHA0) TaxID=1124983 RepID=A0A2C9EPP0_PSEPH|nr:DUF2280 domain-containing protein [Pseudomonas protegens]AGL85579.1 hypothetical protein PFLCHA0_c38130 [Pseudomonas protegens CHA0]MBP5113791.1 DUF2280 domain-containing protein [Pseudomonas protegens]QTU23035.1 DUF2280 domain-containing protein [Pseudomonas protegens]QTU32567.1 DUF2280 domain-containing protein [Pseudomonas protegens]RLO19798.1 DUF2280 domain-containing protein [Pseudomonas protegens]